MTVLNLTEARIRELPLGSGIHRDTQVKGLMVICHKTTKSYACQGDVRRNGRHIRTVRAKIDRVDRIGLREARNRAKALMSQIQSGIDPTDGPEETAITLERAMEAHIEEKPLRPRSEEGYRYHLNHYLKHWRKKAVADISRQMVRDLYAEMKRKNGNTTAGSVMRTLRAVINTAMRIDETLTGNPVAALHVPSNKRRKVAPLDIPEWWERVMRLKPQRRDLHVAMLLTGARRSSILQIKREDVDLERRILTLTHMKTSDEVVAPGSIHPETGNPYKVEIDLDPLDDDLGIPVAPQQLIERGLKPARSNISGSLGKKSPEWLEESLDHLDPTIYRGDHERWLNLMMACHSATGGTARDEFVQWSISDPEYAEQADVIGRRWESLDAEAKGGVTERTLFKHLDDAGVLHLVKADLNEVSEEFDDIDPLDEQHMPQEINKTKAKRQANAKKARKAKIEKAALRKIKQAESTEAFAKWLNNRFVYDRSTGNRVNVVTGEQYDDQVFEVEFGPGWARSGGKGSLVNAIKTGKAGLDLESVMMAAAFPGKGRMVPIDMGTYTDMALNTWYDITLEPVEGNYSWFKEEIERLFPDDNEQQVIMFDYWAAKPHPDDLDEKGPHFQRMAKHYACKEDMAAVRSWLMKDWAKDRIVMEEDGARIAGVGSVRFDDDPPMTDAKRQLMRECLKADNEDALDFCDLERVLEGLDLFSADDVVNLVRENQLDRFDVGNDQLVAAIRKWLNAAGFIKHKRNTNGQGVTLYSPMGDSKWSAMGPTERENSYLKLA